MHNILVVPTIRNDSRISGEVANFSGNFENKI